MARECLLCNELDAKMSGLNAPVSWGPAAAAPLEEERRRLPRAPSGVRSASCDSPSDRSLESTRHETILCPSPILSNWWLLYIVETKRSIRVSSNGREGPEIAADCQAENTRRRCCAAPRHTKTHARQGRARSKEHTLLVYNTEVLKSHAEKRTTRPPPPLGLAAQWSETRAVAYDVFSSVVPVAVAVVVVVEALLLKDVGQAVLRVRA